MKPDWILVANAAYARLLEREPERPLKLLKEFRHPASRLKSAQLGTGKAGRELSGHGFGGAAYGPRTEPHRKEHLKFAQELAQELEHEVLRGRFDKLEIFASDPFLGELKQMLGKGCQRLLAGAYPVDLTSVGLAELGRRIEHETVHSNP